MEGITILEEHILYGPNLISVLLVISGMISLVISIFLLIVDIEEITLAFLIGGILSLLIGIFTIAIIPGPPTGQAKYIIRVEDKIDINKLLDNYKILKHEKYSNIYEIEGDIINDNT